ncbi:MAG TPA: tetratricopeptide repeat protein [Fimbriimonadaceae bacterium]|mgnify:CR=1 FL=1|nr:tetratricopeptide repeat protein [Fimbriimonadaceae bacterium]HRJ97643.1 tetratricopeptide repeat protein [Fimbriimonadaceae bacterium]
MADHHPNGNPTSSQTRQRAVRLTEEGVALLAGAIIERWGKSEERGRLTRKARAEMLGLSLATADRVMSQQGVDRSSILIAFGKLGLEWSDEYCVQARTADPTAYADAVESALEESAVSAQAQEKSELALAQAPSPPARQRRRWVWAVAAFALALVLCLPFSKALDTWGYGHRQRSVHQRLVAEYYAGVRDYQTGNFRSAKEHCERVMTLSREARSYYDLAMALRLAGEIAAAEGDLQLAKRHLFDALSIRLTVNDLPALPATYEVLGDVEIKLGEFASAERHLILSLDGYRRANDQVGSAMALRNLGWLEFQRKDLAKASACYDQALAELHGNSDNEDLVTDIEARQALILREQGRYTEARTVLTECLRHWQTKPHTRWVGRTSFQIGTVERSAGRSELARRWLEEARSVFRSVGDAAGVAECDAEFLTLDLHAGKPTPEALATWSAGR